MSRFALAAAFVAAFSWVGTASAGNPPGTVQSGDTINLPGGGTGLALKVGNNWMVLAAKAYEIVKQNNQTIPNGYWVGYTWDSPSILAAAFIPNSWLTNGYTHLLWHIRKEPPVGPYQMNNSLPGRDGIPLVLDMLKEGKLWDINGDGKIDAVDMELFLDDMDQDGIDNENDDDMDGDGESNYAETAEPESANSKTYKQYDPTRFPDRDGDTLPDLLDKDGDGWANFIEKLAGTNPNEAGSKPPEGYNVIFKNGETGEVYATDVFPPGPWLDTDLDGMWDWLEDLYHTDPNDRFSFHDGNGDGYWDWTGAKLLAGGGVIVVPPVDPPDTPIVTPPLTPVLIGGSGQNAGSPISGAGGGEAGNGPTNGNTVDGNGNPGTGSEQEAPTTPEATTEGEQATVGTWYVVQNPRGVSSAWQGVGGGSWQQRAGPNHQHLAGGAHDDAASKADELANAMKGIEVKEQEQHVLVVPFRWITGSTEAFEIPLMPDPNSDWGAIAESVRSFLRAVAMLFVTYVFIRSVWLVLRQY